MFELRNLPKVGNHLCADLDKQVCFCSNTHLASLVLHILFARICLCVPSQ